MQTFSLLLGLGTLAGLLLSALQAPRKRSLQVVEAGMLVLLGALLGGRAGYVLLQWGYFQAHPAEMLQVWLGGLSGIGALAGGLAVLPLAAAWFGLPLSQLADALAPLGLALGLAAWLGNWLQGSAYGAQTQGWWGLPARDEWGSLSRRLPIQLMGALLALGLLVLSEQAHRLKRPGLPASLGLAGMAFICLGVSLLRVDPGMSLSGLRLEAWGWLAAALLGSALSLLAWQRKPPEN